VTDFNETIAFPLGGGLNLADAPESIEDGDAIELVNVRFPGAGRWAPRFSAVTVASPIGNVCGVFEMPHGADTSNGAANGVVYLVHAGGTRVDLYAADGKGRGMALVGTLAGWDQVAVRPKTMAAVLGEALWIVDENKQHGMTVYDPNQRFGAGKLFQPLFKFEPNLTTPAAPIRARTIGSFNNFLFVAGYGSEADPDRPEMVRFSYLGMEADSFGAGDAGKDDAPVFGDPGYDAAPEHAPGSKALFDIEDVFGVGLRGQPVMSFVAAGARLLMLTRFTAWILFGYDRSTFQADLLDNQRGCVASRAAGEAAGAAYWWSPLGPTTWRGGGGAEGLERRITPIHRTIDFDSIFFAHSPDEYEVRFYHSPDSGDPWKAVEYNYLYDKWKQRELGVRVFCAGLTNPGTILTPGPGGDPLPEEQDEIDPNLAPPVGIFVFPQSPTSAKIIWFNGEIGPTIKTVIEVRKNIGGTFKQAGIVDSGVQELTVDALEAETVYDAKAFHQDTSTGRRSTDIQASFTTFSEANFLPPQNFQVELRREQLSSGVWIVAYVTWGLGQIGSYTTVETAIMGSSQTSFRNTDLNATQERILLARGGETGTRTFRARHSDCFAFDEQINPCGKASTWTDIVTVDMGSV